MSEVYDFLQSSDWQQMLEKARVQREKNLAARAQKAKETQKPEPRQNGPARSTTGNDTGKDRPAKTRPSPEPRNWLDRVEEARQQREAVLARRKSESEELLPSGADSVGKDAFSNRIRGKSRTPPKAPKPEGNELHVNDRQDPALKQPLVGEPWDSETNDTETNQHNTGLRATRSPAESATRLRKKLLQGLVRQKQTEKSRWGAVAIGCAIGVVTSTALFFVYSERNLLGPRETTSVETASTEPSTPAALQNTGTVQLTPPQPSVPNGLNEQAAISSETPQPFAPDAIVAEPNGSNSLAALAPSVTEEPVAADIPELRIQSTAPAVGIPDTWIEQPPLPPQDAGIQPPAEVKPGFVRYQNTPEILVASTALSDEAAILTDSLGFLGDASTPPPRPPIVSIQPDPLLASTALDLVADPGPLPKPALTYQPEPRRLLRDAARPSQSETEDLAALDFADQPEVPFSIVPVPSRPRAAPPTQTEDVARLQPQARPSETSPSDQGVEPTETITSIGGAKFRLFAPASVSDKAVQSVVAGLQTTGHEVSGTARVGFGISQSNVRYYHPQDAEKAAALAKDAGALLRDFTGSRSKTPNGIVELWLAGKSSGRASARATPKRTNRPTSVAGQVNQLRNQVLQKLKSATDQ